MAWLQFILCGGITGALAWGQSLAIERVTVIDGRGRGAQRDMTVAIAGDRIAAITDWKKAKIPRGAKVVDGRGKFLIPGLWDMHVHGASDRRSAWSHLLFLANGVVGVRDMAGPPDARAWRAQQAASGRIAPDVYLGSPIVDGPNPVWPDSIVAANEAQGRAAVDAQQERGADFIKVYSRLPRDVYFAIADEARKRGIPFAGHVPEAVSAAEASDAGQKSIEHLTEVALACSRDGGAIRAELLTLTSQFRAPGAGMADKMSSGKRMLGDYARIPETYDEATAQALFARFAKNGTWQCPTLTLLRAMMDAPPEANDPRLEYLSQSVRTKWATGFHGGIPEEPRKALMALSQAEFENSKKLAGLMYRAGVRIMAGTDAMNPQCFPGFGIHDELALLVESGMTPLDALRAATSNAAEFMGEIDRRGTIEAGKSADLVLLKKDLLADIHNSRSIEAVVLHGKLMTRPMLDGMLAEARRLAGSN